MTGKYNGWTNYETWCVNLWLSNEQEAYRAIRSLCLSQNDEYKGSQALKDFVEEQTEDLLDNMPTRGGIAGTFKGIINDIFRANLHVVDWLEIWRAFREE
jgi:hypothetical protein